MTNKIQEVNYFKGIVSHPNSISVGEGTFRDIKNGWSLRDGIVDKRPGFSIQTDFTKMPGFSSAYTGLRTLNGNTYYRQAQNFGAYGPNFLDLSPPIPPLEGPNQAFYPYTGADTIDCFQVSAIANNGTLLAVSKEMTGFNHEPFLLLFSLATGELVATYADTASSTTPNCTGITWIPDGSAFYFSRIDTNKIYKYVVSTGAVTVIAGTGTAGLQTGAGLTSLNLGPINGLRYYDTGTVKHIYACISNAIYDVNLTANTGAIIAGSATAGHVNATGASAEFNVPLGIDLFTTSPTNLYVADSNNNVVRKVTTAGIATDFTTGVTAVDGISCLTPHSPLTESFYITYTSNTVPMVGTFTLLAPGNFSLAGVDTAYIDGPMAPVAVQNDGGPSFLNPKGITSYQDPLSGSSSVKILVCDFGASRIRLIDTGQNGDGTTVSTWAGSGGNSGGTYYYQKNNLLGFAGGVLPAPSNTVTHPFPAAEIISEFGYGLFEYNGTTYLNTNRGVVAMDFTSDDYSVSQIIRYAGAPQGLDLQLSLTAGTLLAADFAVAYRLVWGYKTATGRTVLGAPSSRNAIDNPVGAGSAQNVVIQSQIPPGIDASWSYQLYRTLTTFQDSSSGVIVDPGDTEFLVFEASPSLTDLGNGFISITDSTPDALLGADLYTNATVETLSQANTQPPICQDMCLFGDLAIYANTVQKQTMFVNLVGLNGFSGSPTIQFSFTDGTNAFTITGNSSTENAPAGQFKYFTGGTPATNVENTAQSIIRTINQYTGNRRLKAYYVSSPDGTPGEIAIIGAFYGCPVFSIESVAAISASFSPPLPTSDATWFGPTYNSVAETLPNGLYVAKSQDPDAVPLVNNFFVGSSAESIWRVLPLRTSVIIIKERSVWRLTGSDASNVQISLLDNTVSLRSAGSCSLLNNEVYALTTQGVVAISDNGVRIISRPIEFELSQATGSIQFPMDLCNNAWGHGSDDWRQYFLSIFTAPSETPESAGTWAYCPLTSSWSRWDLGCYAFTITGGLMVAAASSGLTQNSTGTAYPKPFVISQNPFPLIESAMNYADFGGTARIATKSGTIVTLNNVSTSLGSWSIPDASSTPDVGWVLITVDGQFFFYVLANSSGALTLNNADSIDIGDDVYLWRPIDFFMRYNPMTAGATFMAKQWGDFIAAIESRNVYQYAAGFLQNSEPEGTAFLTQTKQLAQIQASINLAIPDDAQLYLEQVQRLTIPKNACWGNALEWTLQHSEAFGYLVLKAVGVETRSTGADKAQQ